jgi:GT2 family glycosyltransferase
MTQITLSIIIVSYNTSKLTENCVKSILSDKGLSFDINDINSKKSPAEIIIIDNNSQDNSVSVLKKYKQVKLTVNPTNLGFGAAQNQGMRIAKGNYFLLLNSDTVILHSAISQSLDWLSSHPESYACTAQLLNADKTVQPSGGYFPNLLNIFTWSTGIDDLPFINKIVKPLHPHPPEFYTHDPFFTSDHPQDWITGAYVLIRKSAFLKSGGFNESYFMYGEEVEWFYRLHRLYPDKSVWYLVGPQITHFGGASTANKNFPIVKEIHGIEAFFSLHKTKLETIVARILLKLNPSLRLRGLYFLIIGNKTSADFYFKSCSEI